MAAPPPAMNCFLETIASVWLLSIRQVYGPLPADEDTCVQEGLESCRANLEQRELDLAETVARMGKEALRRRELGDLAGARQKMLERRRGLKRLDKLRSSLTLVDAQLDALRTTELDKELMHTLLASSAALKKAGVGKGVKEAEQVMSELEEQLRESGELTSVLSGALADEADLDLDEELEALGLEPPPRPLAERLRPETVNSVGGLHGVGRLEEPSLPEPAPGRELVSG